MVSSLPSENRIFCTLVLPSGFGCGYKLKHPSWIFDDAGVNLIGVAIIRETVTPAKGGDSFTGDVTIDVYDLSGNPLQHIDATIQALRITTDDSPKEIGFPGFPTWPKMP